MTPSRENSGVWKAVKFLNRYLAGRKDFCRADLSGIVLYRSIFYDLLLDEAILKQASLKRVNFAGSSFKQAQLQQSNLRRANLSGCDLKQASLQGAVLVRANLNNTDLMEADLSDTDLRYADLSHAQLEGANLKGANLRCTALEGAIYTNDTLFDEGFNPAAAGMFYIGDWTVLEFTAHHLNEKRKQTPQHRSFRLSNRRAAQ